MRYSKIDKAMRTADKPRIRYTREYGIYRCTGQALETVGISPAQAYSAWETCNEARKEIAQPKGPALMNENEIRNFLFDRLIERAQSAPFGVY